MTPDPVLDLSVEQLISALNKKLFMEYERVQSTVPPASRALAARLRAEVRSDELKTDPRILTKYFTGQRSGEKSQRYSA